MGDLTEMILDGTLCMTCMVCMIDEDEEPCGFPVECDDCKKEREEDGD